MLPVPLPLSRNDNPDGNPVTESDDGLVDELMTENDAPELPTKNVAEGLDVIVGNGPTLMVIDCVVVPAVELASSVTG